MNQTGLVFEEFEPRILYSADLAPLALAGLADQQIDARWLSTSDSAQHEIAFVDLSLADAQTLVDDLRAQAQAGRDLEVITIAAGEDGIALVTATLAQRNDIGAVHLLSHGSDGLVLLGSSRLDATTLLARAGEVAGWGNALTADADLLIYGCDVAASARGQQFVAGLAALTGADVAASTDATGAALRGGDWDLEVASGSIQAASALTPAQQQAWQQLMLLPTGEIPVNQITNGDQQTSAENRGSQQAVAVDAAGNYVVVWTSKNQDGNGWGVYARRFDASGNAISSETLVNTTTNSDQRSARVASDAAGNFVVTWTSKNQDGTSDSVYARRFNGNGIALTAETRVNTTATGAQTDSVIAMSASTGDYVIAWQGEGPGDSAGIFFRRFFADGTAKDATDRLANLPSAGTENDPAVTMAADGRFVIVWEVNSHLYLQRFDAAGNGQGGAMQVDSGFNLASGASIVSDAAGNFTVAYRALDTMATDSGVWVKGFNADGTVKYSWSQVDSGDATSPSIDMASDGSFVVVYQKTGDALDVFARKYNANGSPAGAAFLINQSIVQDQLNASVSMVDANNYVVVWNGSGPGDPKGVFARQFGPSVQITATQDTYINSGSTSNYGTSASLVVDRAGGNLGNGRALLQFDLSAIPAGATITGATLELQATANASPFMIDVYRLTEAWVEGNGGTSAANWNSRLPGTAWTNINGASVDSTPAATWATLPPAGAGTHSWDLTNLVRAWQTGSSANYGILLGSTATGTTTVTYGSSESVTPPRLVVTYALKAAPVNTVPGAQSTDEDTAKVFSTANGNQISITDADAGGANNEVTLSVSNGSLTLAGTAGLSFTAGDGSADTTMTFRGTVSAINTALDGLSYSPTANYNGGATLALATKDSGLLSLDIDTGLLGRYAFENSGALGTDTSPAAGHSGTASGATSVNDATRGDVLGLAGAGAIQATGRFGNPANVTLSAWVNLSSADSSGAEVISLGDSVSLRLDQSDGTIDGAFYNGSGFTRTSFATTLAGTGWHHVAYTFNNTSNTATLYLDGVAVGTTSTTNSINYTLGANSFIGKHGNGQTTFDFDGKIDDARVYNRALTAGEIATLATDLSMIDRDTVAITVSAVNDAPTTTNLSAAETYTEDTVRNLIDIVVSDVDSANVTATLSLSNVSAGSLNTGTSGAVTSTFVAGVWTASGAIANVNTLLAGVSFTPTANFNGNFTIASSVSDGVAAPVTGSKAVTGAAVNDAPVITSNGGGPSAAISVAENATAVTAVGATDVDLPAQALTYAISGGADAAKFSINTSTGVLSFIAAPNHEAPTDVGANNIYDVTVRVSDGTLTDTQAIAVTVSDANEFPVGTIADANAAANSVAENAGVGTLVGVTANAVDPDAGNNAVTYTLDNSAGGRFAIDSSTGVLSVAGALDYETATSHTVTVRAGSADGSFSTAVFTIGVTDVSESAVGAISDVNAAVDQVAENASAGALVGITASAIDATPLDVVTFSLIDGAGGRFAIDTTTGVVVVAGALDAETALRHTIVVRADSTDGSFNTQAFTIGLADVNEFAIAVVGDTDAAADAVDETAAVGTLVGITASAFDADATTNTVLYSLDDSAGGRFAIDAGTGVVTVAGAIDREVAPGHAIVVRATSADGSFATQNFAVVVKPVNDNAPEIGSDGGAGNASVNVAENSTAVTTVLASDADLPAQTLTCSIIGGADQAMFSIDASTGVLSFVSNPDYEAPTDADADNVYDVTVQVSDGTLTDTQMIAVTVTPANDNAPVIISNGGGSSVAATVAENNTSVTTVNATDADLPAQTLRYSMVGGADAAAFSINTSTGALSFIAAPDFETPTDAGANNVYDVVVQASDGSLGDSQAIAITVTNVNETPVITSSGGGATAALDAAENQSAVVTVAATDVDATTTLTYAITGGADAALFSINASTGVLGFIAAPDFETPTDAGANNVYDVIVQASDGSLGDSQAIAVTVADVNEAPQITSSGAGATAALSVAENQSAVVSVAATDVDAATTLTYAITGGADAAQFSIDVSTGVLSFVTAPNFEAPADAGADNVYHVVVQASDGSLTDSQAIAVTVSNIGEAPVIVTNKLVIAEAGSATPAGAGADADTPAAQLVYTVSALAGGQFEMLGAVGLAVTSFSQADLDAGQVRFVHDGGEAAPAYRLSLSDGTLATAAQAATVSFTPVNDAPGVLSVDLGSIAEDGSRLVTAAELLAGASDAEGDSLAISNLVLTSGQASLVDQGNGSWLLTPVPNWNGSVALSFNVSDGTATLSNTAGLAVSPVADAPRITGAGGGAAAVLAVAENTTTVTTMVASPGDGPGPLRHSISGGADAAAFSIDAASGVLSFVTAPDREQPTDAGADNRYEVTVRVSDGTLFDEQAIAVDVGNVDEAPALVRNELLLDNGAPTVVLLATDPDTPDTALLYQTSGEVGGRFERSTAPGLAIASFTQADVNAGNVRFVVDGSGLTPTYALQLSDGVTTSAPALPTVVDISVVATPVATPVAAAEPTTLPAPAAELVDVPAAVPADIAPAAAAAEAPPAGKPAPATAPRAPQANAVETPAGAETNAIAFERSADRAAAASIATGELRASAHDGADTVAAVALPIDLMNWAQIDANAGADTSADTPRQDLAAALRERSLSQALDGLRRGIDAAQGNSEQLVVGSTTLSAGLSVGYVLWLARGGVLMASVLSALPAWASLDPLPVLGQVKGKTGVVGAAAGDNDEEEGDDAVENLFDKRRPGDTLRAPLPATNARSAQGAP